MSFMPNLVSEGVPLTIDVLDGKEILANATEVFLAGIDGDLKNWALDKVDVATKETAVNVYELVSDATFAQMFGSLSNDLDKLCLTQAQIKSFCRKYPDWIRGDGFGTFFLFKVEDHFLVDVRVYSRGLDIGVFRFKDIDFWRPGYSHRLMVPRLIA